MYTPPFSCNKQGFANRLEAIAIGCSAGFFQYVYKQRSLERACFLNKKSPKSQSQQSKSKKSQIIKLQTVKKKVNCPDPTFLTCFRCLFDFFLIFFVDFFEWLTFLTFLNCFNLTVCLCFYCFSTFFDFFELWSMVDLFFRLFFKSRILALPY